MKVIATIDNIDFILPNEDLVEFVDGKALVKLVGLANISHLYNKDRDKKLNILEFKKLIDFFKTDKNTYPLMLKYQNIILNTDIYTLIDKDFNECNLKVSNNIDKSIKYKFSVYNTFNTQSIERLSKDDFIIKDNDGTFYIKIDDDTIVASKIISDEYKITNIPKVLKSKHKILNLNTMKESRYYDYIGDFSEFIKDDGTVYNASHAYKNVTAKEIVDGSVRTKISTLDFFIDEEGKIISPLILDFDNEVININDSEFDIAIGDVVNKLNKSIRSDNEKYYAKKLLMKRKSD